MRSSFPNMARQGDHDYDFVAPVKLEIECSICLQTLQDPHLVSCCGHNFCRECISRIEREHKPCPLCKKWIFSTMANQSLRRALNNSKVHCPHRELGCRWVGELGKLDQHLNADPQPKHQLEGCSYTSVKCIHCKDHMRRHVIASHQNKGCPKRPYTCEFCEEYESTFEDVVDHWEECKCYRLQCPNRCQPLGIGIERQNLDHHVENDCPLTVVECDFHYAGCRMKLPRKAMPNHMRKDALVHVSLLTAMNQKLTRQLLEKDEQLLVQQRQLSNLERNTDRITENLTTLQKTTTPNLERNHRELEQRLRNNRTKLEEEISFSQATAAASCCVLILVISVALGCVLYYYVPLHREHQDLVNTVTQHHREHQVLANSVANYHREHQVLANSVANYHREHQVLADSVAHHHKEHHDLVDRVTQDFLVQFQTAYGKIVPVDLKMCGFNTSIPSPLYSAPFYTHLFGYKMCLKVFANGNGDSKGTHTSVFTVLMHGEFDTYLDWPFRDDITIQLLSQDDTKDRTTTILYTDETDDKFAGQVTDGEKSAMGLGRLKFIPHSELDSYLQDNDCLIFKIL